jgi:hypothetical protein
MQQITLVKYGTVMILVGKNMGHMGTVFREMAG